MVSRCQKSHHLSPCQPGPRGVPPTVKPTVPIMATRWHGCPGSVVGPLARGKPEGSQGTSPRGTLPQPSHLPPALQRSQVSRAYCGHGGSDSSAGCGPGPEQDPAGSENAARAHLDLGCAPWTRRGPVTRHVRDVDAQLPHPTMPGAQ